MDFVLLLAEHMSTWHKMVHDTLARGVAEGSRESTRIAIKFLKVLFDSF